MSGAYTDCQPMQRIIQVPSVYLIIVSLIKEESDTSVLFFSSKCSPFTIQQIKSKTGEYFNLRHFVIVVDRIP